MCPLVTSKKLLLAAVFWAAMGAFLSGPARGADQTGKALERIRIAYSAISSSQLVGWVAYEGGFFRKNGLDVEFIFIEGGPRAVRTVASGDVPVALVAGAPVIQSHLQGSSVVLITGFLNTLDYQFVVDKNIVRPDQLKGKAVAVSQTGSSSDFAMRYTLEQYRLEPGKDVTIVEIGSQPARFAALESGKIQGVMVAVPLTLTAKKMGFNILADLQMLGLEYQYTALATSREFIKARPDVVRSVVKASVEAIHFIKTHRQETLDILRKYMGTNDAEALVEAYEAIGINLIREKPYPTLRGIQLMLRELSMKEPKFKTAKPEQFVDTTFLKELDASGYIDRLYKTAPVVAKAQSRSAAPAVSLKEAPDVPAVQKEQLGSSKERAGENPVQESTPASTQEYSIVAGDTLSRLAARYYGDARQWPRIYQANRRIIKNPHYIYIGQRIVIPAEPASA